MTQVQYDDRQLQQLFEELSPRNRMKVFRGAFRRAATTVRREAVRQLKATGVANAAVLGRGIYAKVFRRNPGFKVSIAPVRGTRKGYYRSRRKNRNTDKPVLLWLEEGTDQRNTKGRGGMRRYTRRRSGHSTGRMIPRMFMAITKSRTEGTVTSELHDQIRQSLVRIARKYGCI